MRIGIAGAGLLGRLLAFELAQTGHEVQVFDPATDGAQRGAAGWTAAGMLSPTAELECANAEVFSLGLRSLQRWPELLNSLRRPVEFHQRGSLLLAHPVDGGAAQRVITLLQSKAPAEHAPQALSATALRQLEPCISTKIQAWLLPREGCIHTVEAMLTLADSASELGVRWHWQQAVSAVLPGQLKTARGAQHFDWCFDVRGTGAAPTWPVRGVRGEVFWLDAPGLQLQRPLRLLHPRYRVYIVPRAGQRVVVGASEIESEDRSPVSLRSTVELLTAAHSVLPELAEARLVHSESNLRPALPDNLPRWHSEAGLTRINGLFRHGWLIAPALVDQALTVLNAEINAHA